MAQSRRRRAAPQPPRPPHTPPRPPHTPRVWPDGKHRSWATIDIADRASMLQLIRARATTDDILTQFPDVTVGTLAAVKANLNR